MIYIWLDYHKIEEPAGFEIVIIDTSSVKNLTASAKEKYWNLIRGLLSSVLARKESNGIEP